MTETLREICWLLKMNLSKQVILKTVYLMMEEFGAHYLNEYILIQPVYLPPFSLAICEVSS